MYFYLKQFAYSFVLLIPDTGQSVGRTDKTIPWFSFPLFFIARSLLFDFIDLQYFKICNLYC